MGLVLFLLEVLSDLLLFTWPNTRLVAFTVGVLLVALAWLFWRLMFS